MNIRSPIILAAIFICAAGVLEIRPTFAQPPAQKSAPEMSLHDLMNTLRDSFDRLESKPTFEQLMEVNQLTTQFTTRWGKQYTEIMEKLQTDFMNKARQEVTGKGYQFIAPRDFYAKGVELLLSKEKIGLVGRYIRIQNNAEFLIDAILSSARSYKIPLLTTEAPSSL